MSPYKNPLSHKATYVLIRKKKKRTMRNKYRHREILIEQYIQVYVEMDMFSNKYLRQNMYKTV